MITYFNMATESIVDRCQSCGDFGVADVSLGGRHALLAMQSHFPRHDKDLVTFLASLSLFLLAVSVFQLNVVP